MHPDLVRTFIEEFHREANKKMAEQDRERHRVTRELEKIERDLQKLIDAIKQGAPGDIVKDEMSALDAKRSGLRIALEAMPASIPRLHPNIAKVYQEKVASLTDALNRENIRDGSSRGATSANR